MILAPITFSYANSSFSESELIAQNKPCGCVYACTCEPICETLIPCAKAYNAPLRFASCWGLFIEGSFLYWNGSMQNLELGTTYTNSESAFYYEGKKIGLDFEYNSAFRLALGYQLCHDYWQTYIEYTRYHQTFKGKQNTDNLQHIFPYWIIDTTAAGNEIYETSGRWHLGLDLIDWYLARQYYVGQYLSFKPFFGLRGLIIEQNFRVKYIPTTTYVSLNSTNKSSSWGIGPRAGVDTWWAFCGNLRIFGNVSAGLVYQDFYKIRMQHSTVEEVMMPAPLQEEGKKKVSAKVVPEVTAEENPEAPTSKEKKATLEPTNLETLTLNMPDSLQELRYDCSFAIGLGYEDYVFYDRYHFNFSIGYEFNLFLDQNVFSQYQTITDNRPLYGDLFLHGLTVKLSIDY